MLGEFSVFHGNSDDYYGDPLSWLKERKNKLDNPISVATNQPEDVRSGGEICADVSDKDGSSQSSSENAGSPSTSPQKTKLDGIDSTLESLMRKYNDNYKDSSNWTKSAPPKLMRKRSSDIVDKLSKPVEKHSRISFELEHHSRRDKVERYVQ